MLTVIITARNEPDLPNTIRSLRETAPAVPVIIIDDCSKPAIDLNSIVEAAEDYTEIISWKGESKGVGPARHDGIIHAQTPYVLLTDAHMRFAPGWYEAALSAIRHAGRGMFFCGKCLGLTPEHATIAEALGEYNGATWNFWGPDRQNPRKHQAMEVIWGCTKPKSMDPIPALMGATYLVPREFYLNEMGGGLQHLRSWGGDEALLSLKAWLCGGTILMLPEVRIGHIFTEKRSNYRPPEQHVNSNKFWNIRTLLPPKVARAMIEKLAKRRDMLTGYRHYLCRLEAAENEADDNASRFTRDFDWYLNHFNLECNVM